ncbi:LysE family translocator [Thalassococcus sp. BH17M4-6]|uniref:LysE family translocator n=1 Tax=Thalassococcus sp. BH17M4-6 TaxID=3413148 RepID=UPI003BCCD195
MPVEVWLIFVLSSLGILLVPGPTMLLVVGYTVMYGRTSAWVTVPAVTLAGGLALSLSMLGLDAIKQMSPVIFWLLKMAGAGYLLFLAANLWFAAGVEAGQEKVVTQDARRRIFLNVFTVTALNPKGLVFFIAFIPQFMARSTEGPVLWMTIEVTYMSLVALVFLGYALLAAKAASLFKRQAESALIPRCAAVMLATAAVATAWI